MRYKTQGTAERFITHKTWLRVFWIAKKLKTHAFTYRDTCLYIKVHVIHIISSINGIPHDKMRISGWTKWLLNINEFFKDFNSFT